MAQRPSAVAFDVLQTLFSLEPLRAKLTELGLPESALELWFARTLRDGFALAATGALRSFREVATGTLETQLIQSGLRGRTNQISAVLDAFAELPAQPDAAEAMQTIRDAGTRVIVLTNGNDNTTQTLLKRAGLIERVEQVLSIEQAGYWKPRAELYHYAADQLRLQPNQLALIAAHAWDCHGAKRAGLTAAWVSRVELSYNAAFDQPDVRGHSLTEVCQSLLQLPR